MRVVSESAASLKLFRRGQSLGERGHAAPEWKLRVVFLARELPAYSDSLGSRGLLPLARLVRRCWRASLTLALRKRYGHKMRHTFATRGPL